MSLVPPTEVESYLREYGWKFEALGAQIWASGWQSGRRYFSVRFHLQDHFLNIKVSPFEDGEWQWETWPELLGLLLRFNAQMKGVQVGIEDALGSAGIISKFSDDTSASSRSGSLVLNAHIPACGLNYATFSKILGILAYYSEVVAEDVSNFLSRCCTPPHRHGFS